MSENGRRVEPDFKTLFERAPSPSVALDPELRVIAASDAYLQATRINRHDIIGRPFFEVFPHNPENPFRDATHKIRVSLNRVLQNHAADQIVVQRYGLGRPEPEGDRSEVLYWRSINSPVLDPEGSLICIIHGVEEITDQQIDDSENVELQRLRDSEKIYRTIGELIPYGIWITDREGGVTYLSQSFLDLVGMTLEEVKEFGWLDRYPPERIQQFLADWKKTLESGRFWDYEHPIRDKNGVYQVILSRGVPFRDDEGRITSWVGINLDISQLKQTQEELRKAREELELKIVELNKAKETAEAANKTKDMLFATISHELRTPLALILGPVQKRLAAGGLDEEERRDLLVVQRNARTLLKHVNDLLDLSKLQVGQMAADYAKVDLAWIVRVVGSLFESIAEERRIGFTLKTPPELRAELDPDKVQRVILNLLSNAFKFTPLGGRVVVRLRSGDGKALLEVGDSGPGIPESQREAIFERFRQLDPGATRRFGGTGLGLSIVKEFVQLHGGHVRVDSAPSGGAIFAVELPLRAPHGTHIRTGAGELDSEMRRQAVDDLRLHPRGTAPVLDSLANSPLVLVVEDNPDMNTYIAEALGKHYRVAIAENGKEGLAMALEQRPDLIVSDIMMPEMSGDQMVRELRRHREFDLTPIVLLSAKADEQLRESLLRDAVQDYIYKPFSTTDLLARVSRLISERKREVETLQRSEEHYRVLFQKSPFPTWTIDLETYAILEVNDAAVEHYGYSREEFLQMTLTEIRTPEEFEKFKQWVKTCGEGGKKCEGRMLTKHRKKNNELIDVEVQYIEIGYKGRRTAYGTVIDVTERERAQKLMRDLNAILEQKVSERTELAEARARQLQALAVELIEAEERERQRISTLLHEDLQQILAAARFQLKAIYAKMPQLDELSDIERMLSDSIGKSRRLSHETGPTILHHMRLIEALQWLSRHMYERFGLVVRIHAEKVLELESTPLKIFIFRAVQELLFNVIKHGGVRSANVQLTSSDDNFSVTVSDQGRGFEPAIVESSDPKTGLGLLSLRERTSYFRGNLSIESAPGRGSKIRINVPFSAFEARPSVDEHQLASRGDASDKLQGEVIKVMFVDDHKVMRQGLIKLISGVPDISIVGEAADGREALELARYLKPDVVVMDISMPGMDGIEATRRIKAEINDVRVIGLSMHGDEHLLRAMINAGAEAFVSKTASSAELLKSIYGK